jgi:hypothetical protein
VLHVVRSLLSRLAPVGVTPPDAGDRVARAAAAQAALIAASRSAPAARPESTLDVRPPRVAARRT